jgi:hypothetical protein
MSGAAGGFLAFFLSELRGATVAAGSGDALFVLNDRFAHGATVTNKCALRKKHFAPPSPVAIAPKNLRGMFSRSNRFTGPARE